MQASLAVLKDRLESGPWREDNDKLRQELVGHSTRLQEALEEQRVQLNAHAQVFQSTQTAVVQQQHDIAALQAETSQACRRGEGDLASLSARIDQLRVETSERDTSNFTEATQHADRLAQRLQQDVLRLEQQPDQPLGRRRDGVEDLGGELELVPLDELHLQGGVTPL